MLFEDRRRAESFGIDAERYDRTRPSYPDALIDAVLAGGDGGRPLDVLDVGCGTGIAARLMAAKGAHVVGVEIDARMASVARAGGIEVEVARFEEWDDKGRNFDRITAGQAWHWVDPAAGAEKAARLLRPGGRLCLFWNIAHVPGDLQVAFDAVYEREAPGADDYSVVLGHATYRGYEGEREGIRGCAALTDPVEERFPWQRTYTTAQWLAQLPTHSDHATMEPERLTRVVEGIGAAIDGAGGSFEMVYDTLLITAGRVE